MLPKKLNEPMSAPVILEKQIEIKPLHLESTEEVTDSGKRHARSGILRYFERYGEIPG
ncbi:MAG: hypothetical protein P8X89_15335 [Reinekea sp.]